MNKLNIKNRFIKIDQNDRDGLKNIVYTLLKNLPVYLKIKNGDDEYKNVMFNEELFEEHKKSDPELFYTYLIKNDSEFEKYFIWFSLGDNESFYDDLHGVFDEPETMDCLVIDDSNKITYSVEKPTKNNFIEITLWDVLKGKESGKFSVPATYFELIRNLDKFSDYAKDYDKKFNNPNDIKIQVNWTKSFYIMGYEWNNQFKLSLGNDRKSKIVFCLPVINKNEEIANMLICEFLDEIQNNFPLVKENGETFLLLKRNFTPEKFDMFKRLQQRAFELNGENFYDVIDEEENYFIEVTASKGDSFVDVKAIKKYDSWGGINLPLILNLQEFKTDDAHPYLDEYFNF